MDVDTAYLNATLNEDIYITQPKGFEDKTELVCKLKKAIYGLKQAGLAWYQHLSGILFNMGFRKATSDTCLFVKHTPEPLLLATYVDDIVIASTSQQLINEFEQDISKYLKIKILGDIKHILGWKIDIMDNGDVIAHQAHYIDRVLKKFRMANSNPVNTPSLKEQQLITEKTQNEIDFPYRQAVGSLLYISNSTRPDIAQAVHHAARFVGSPTEQNVQAVKRIMKYLKGTINYGIIFKKSSNTDMIGFADADYSNDPQDAHSTSGYIFKTNGPVVWKSKKQSLTATSTTEAEVIALHEAAKEAVWLSDIVADMTGSDDKRPIIINEDNAACLALVNGKRTPARTRHLTRRISYIRDLIEANKITVIKCSTIDMLADPLTKPIGPIDLRRKTRGVLGAAPTNIDDGTNTNRDGAADHDTTITMKDPPSDFQTGVAAPSRSTLPTLATSIETKATKSRSNLHCHGHI